MTSTHDWIFYNNCLEKLRNCTILSLVFHTVTFKWVKIEEFWIVISAGTGGASSKSLFCLRFFYNQMCKECLWLSSY